jgi:hypothetical protein
MKTAGGSPMPRDGEEGDYFESKQSDAANSICFYSWDVGSSGHVMDTL